VGLGKAQGSAFNFFAFNLLVFNLFAFNLFVFIFKSDGMDPPLFKRLLMSQTGDSQNQTTK